MSKKSKNNITKGKYSRTPRHGKNDVHDLILLTRKSSKIPLSELSGFWGEDSDAQERLALFILYNKQSFSFLSIDVYLSEDGNPALVFQPSEKAGVAPLFSPVNGKICASIIVKGNLSEDISEVLPLIEGDIEISFSDKLRIQYKSAIKPPLYFECAKFIDEYIKAQRNNWKKFISEEKLESSPTSSTIWTKYASRSYDPNAALKYPNKKNLLSNNHTEWRALNYVLKMCLDELSNPTTPRVSRLAYKEKVESLRRSIKTIDLIKPDEIKIHSSDPLDIKKLKQTGNRILSSITSEYRAWCIDFSILFERYVQYIFKQVAIQTGCTTYTNNRFAISGFQTKWTLSYLEPDVLIRKGNKVIAADAKYKMNMYNIASESVASLKEAFRHDLHQILAYSSFLKDTHKTSILVYPCKTFRIVHQRLSSSITAANNDLYLIGIPWGECLKGNTRLSIREKVSAAVNGLKEVITCSV